jgi:hypothetical protein
MKHLLLIPLAVTSIWASATLAAAPVRPDCDLRVQELGEAKVNGYDALAGGEYLERIRLRISNRGDGTCSGSIRISERTGTTGLNGPGTNKLSYVIVAPFNISQVVFDPVSRQDVALPFTVGPRTNVEINPSLRVPGGQAGRSGRYASVLTATVSAAQETTDTDFTVSAQVHANAQANFVGLSSRDATLDFGELRSGQSKGVVLQVRATSDVDMEISSENRGNLKLAGGIAAIPYQMTLAGRSVDLSAVQTLDVALADSVRGSSLPVEVVIGQFSQKPLGNYSDVVTFRISAR